MVEAQQEGLDIVGLVTFAPAGGADTFKAHPMSIIKEQAAAMGLLHVIKLICPGEGSNGYVEAYRERIRELREESGADVLVTGDILDVCDGFMARACENTGLHLHTPLWQRPREDILQSLENRKFELVISCVSIEKMGKERAEGLVGEAWVPGLITEEENVDLCGEFGEYHTMVTYVPDLYKRKIGVRGKQALDDTGKYLYFQFSPSQ